MEQVRSKIFVVLGSRYIGIGGAVPTLTLSILRCLVTVLRYHAMHHQSHLLVLFDGLSCRFSNSILS